MTFSRDAFLKTDRRKVGEVDLEDGVMRVRALSARDLNRVRQSAPEGGADEMGLQTVVGIVIASALDEGGDLLFSDRDLEALMDAPVGDMNKIAQKALSLSGLDVDLNAPSTADPLVL